MAKITGSVEKNGYGFYAVLTETKPSNYLSTNATTVNYSVYIQNGNKRTNSNNWTFNAKIDGSNVYNKTSQSLVTNDTDYNTAKLLFSGSKSITHDTDGSKTITFSASLTKSTSYSSYDPGKCELEGTFKLTTIERMATVLTATDFTDEERPTLTFSNPAEFTVYPYINFYDDSNNKVFSLYRDSESIKSPYTWEITDEERNSLWKATNQQQSYKVEIGVETYNDYTSLGSSSVIKTMSYVNAEPKQLTVFTELNQKVIDLLGSSTTDIIIQNISQLKLVSTPIAKKNATITKIQFEHNNISIADSETPYEYTVTPVNSIFKVTVNDSRKYSTPESYTKDIIEYLPMNILSFSIKRVSPTSSNIILNSEIRYKQATFGTTENTPTIMWKCGKDGDLIVLSEEEYTLDTANNLIKVSNLILEEVKPYTEEDTIYLYVSDLLTSDAENKPLLRGIPTMDMGKADVNINGSLYLSDEDGLNKMKLNVSGKISKNLFDKNNVNALQGYIVSSTTQIVGSDTGRTFFIKCKPNTTYTISKLASRLNVGYAINKPSVGGKVYSVKDGIANETTELTYTTGYDAKYLVVFYHVSTIMSPSEQEVLDSIQVEKGPIATKYEDYFEPALLIRNSDGIFQEISPRKIRLTFNHDYVYTTDLQYDCFKIGKMVFLNIYTIAFSKAIPSLTDFIYGLPKPTEYIIFALHGHMTAQGDGLRCGLDNSTGNIKTHYDGPEYYGSTTGTQYSCVLIYEAKE